MPKSKINSQDDKDAYYVLSSANVYHQERYEGNPPEINIIGVFSSKDAAVSVAGTVETDYGTFDMAIKGDWNDCYIDNRKNPPDCGILLQIGNDKTGEGDYVKLYIEKFPKGRLGPKSSEKAQQNNCTLSNYEMNGEDNNRFVYLVWLEMAICSFSFYCHPESTEVDGLRIIGAYTSKEKAVSEAGNVSAISGTFDKEIKGGFKDCHVDRRKNPPDYGTLLEIGDKDFRKGDHLELWIGKFAVEGGSNSNDSENDQQPVAKKQKKEIAAGDSFP